MERNAEEVEEHSYEGGRKIRSTFKDDGMQGAGCYHTESKPKAFTG